MIDRARIEILQTSEGKVSFEALNHTQQTRCTMEFTQEQIEESIIGSPEWLIKQLLMGVNKSMKK